MEFLAPGWHEIVRRTLRVALGLRLRWRRRRLARAEAQLGLLGWQQADYDPETQREVQQIENVEREQTRLVNESAALALERRRVAGEREAAQKEYEEARRAMEADARRGLEPPEGIERQLAELRKVEPNFEKRIPELNRELQTVQRRYAELLGQFQQNSAERQELIRLRERSVAIPNEKSDLRTAHLRTVTEIRSLEGKLVQQREAAAAGQAQLQRLEAEWQACDRTFAEQLRVLEREKTRLEKRTEALESQKSNPYQRIGQVLADNGIAPLNQPGALEKVRELRFAVGETEQGLLESVAASAQEEPGALRTSLLLWAGMAAGVLVVLLAVLG